MGYFGDYPKGWFPVAFQWLGFLYPLLPSLPGPLRFIGHAVEARCPMQMLPIATGHGFPLIYFWSWTHLGHDQGH